MLIRHAVESDHERLLPLILQDPLGWVDETIYRQYLASGSYGTDRIWLAGEDGQIAACAVWYGAHPSDYPFILDCLSVASDVRDKPGLAAAVLHAGHSAFRSRGFPLPHYHLFLTPAWRSDAMTCAEIDWRCTAARMAGLTNQIERLRFEWTAGTHLAPSPSSLVFAIEPDDDVFLDAFRRVAVNSLDQETRDTVATLGLESHARATLTMYRSMRGRREWWRMAYTSSGDLVGFTIPAANEDSFVIGYLGVVPEMRGRGYASEMLAEATRILAEQGADRIRGDTDTTNLPMAITFERNGYRNFGVRLVLFGSPG